MFFSVYNKSFIGQACSFKMAPRSFFTFLWTLTHVLVHKHAKIMKLANYIQPS